MSNSVLVTTHDGRTWQARRVVVAVPPPLAARISYDPPLPAERDALTQRLPMGSLIKCVAVYPQPFWRGDGLTGQGISLRGPIGAVYDSSPIDSSRVGADNNGAYGVLLGFIEGATAREHARKTHSQRRAAVIGQLTRLFGNQATNPTRYIEQDWTAEPWSRGGYAAVFPPGAWTHFGTALRHPAGRIHWAGTETATRWYGYIEGAIRSANRVTDEITNA